MNISPKTSLKFSFPDAIDMPMKTHELKLPRAQQSPWVLYIATGMMLIFMTWLLIWA